MVLCWIYYWKYAYGCWNSTEFDLGKGKPMSEYIERGAAIEAIGKKFKQYGYVTKGDYTRAIKSIPAADVEPVVRCSKCRYWEIIGKDEEEGFCKFRAGYTTKDYYCADGGAHGKER